MIEVKPIHKTRNVMKTKRKYYGIRYNFQISKKKIIGTYHCNNENKKYTQVVFSWKFGRKETMADI